MYINAKGTDQVYHKKGFTGFCIKASCATNMYDQKYFCDCVEAVKHCITQCSYLLLSSLKFWNLLLFCKVELRKTCWVHVVLAILVGEYNFKMKHMSEILWQTYR